MKTALVTGAGHRIGKAIAERLLSADYQLILHANSSFQELTSWVSAHERRDQVLELIGADLGLEQGQDELIGKVSRSISQLDLLVHNASAFSPVEFAKINRKVFKDMWAINLEAPFFVTQGLLPLLKAAPFGSVINIIDAMWQRPSPKFSHYAVSKAGLAILTRALASELAPHIRVNAVAPGAILFQPFHSQEARDKTLERIPFKRLGSPEDIANAVVFLSDEAHYATGEILVIDGGRSINS